MYIGNTYLPFGAFAALIWLAALTLTGIVIMGADKIKARRGSRRVPEKTLFLIAAIGGSVGIWAGMYIFRHKTLHKKFKFGIPAIIIAQIAICYAISHFSAM